MINEFKFGMISRNMITKSLVPNVLTHSHNLGALQKAGLTAEESRFSDPIKGTHDPDKRPNIVARYDRNNNDNDQHDR